MDQTEVLSQRSGSGPNDFLFCGWFCLRPCFVRDCRTNLLQNAEENSRRTLNNRPSSVVGSNHWQCCRLTFSLWGANKTRHEVHMLSLVGENWFLKSTASWQHSSLEWPLPFYHRHNCPRVQETTRLHLRWYATVQGVQSVHREGSKHKYTQNTMFLYKFTSSLTLCIHLL